MDTSDQKGLGSFSNKRNAAVGDIMRRKPLDPGEKILSRHMLSNILVTGLVASAIIITEFAYYLPDVAKAMTVAFTSLVLIELVNMFRIRYEAGHSPLSNRKLLIVICVSVAMQMAVVYTPFLQPIFDTVPLNAVDIGFVVAGIVAFIIYGLVRIAVLRKSKRAKTKS